MTDNKSKTKSPASRTGNAENTEETSAEEIAGVHVISPKDIEMHFGTESGSDRPVSGRDHAAKHKNAEPGGKD